MQNIQQEARILSKSQLDIDLLRRSYVKVDSGVTVHFVSPYLLAYEKYRHFLLANSIKKKLVPQYFYRPDYLSYDIYGTTIFWTVLLFINNVTCLEEFKIDEVYIPTYFSISAMSELNEEEKNITDLDDIVEEKEFWPKLYEPNNYTQYIKDSTVSSFPNLQPYRRESFIISIDNINNQYVDLNQIPVIESIVVRLKDQVFVPLYGVHYIIKENVDGDNMTLSWSDSDSPSGTGMGNVILLNTILEVQYQTESST